MKNLQRGFIGKIEINKAINELKKYWENDNLFINSKMQGKIISCYRYKNLEDLLDDDMSLETFTSLEKYIDNRIEIDEDYSKFEDENFKQILELFKKYDTVYISSNMNSGATYIDDNKDFCIKQILENEYEDIYFYTYNEALKNLQGDIKNVNEDLVIALLS